ncbi:Uncharacterised protein [Mycobacterium tuberculosis]|nr:Uncharacterised protein [Mycobacterium tuberculosis]
MAVGQVRHQHVEADVDAELVDHQHPARAVEPAEYSARSHYDTTWVGSITVVLRVHRVTTASSGEAISSGSVGGCPPSSSCSLQYASL